ncbi:MAG: PAS domain S-box protein [Planctomycetota bacterium]|nr:PAS domain S-box protein [Planctomycetota bacterium]
MAKTEDELRARIDALEAEKAELQDALKIAKQRFEQEKTVAEQQIQSEQYIAESILESLPGIFYLYNEKGNLLRWNKRLAEVTGYGGGELENFKVLDFFPNAKDEALIVECMQNSLAHGQSTTEAYLTTKQGATIPFFFSSKRFRQDGQTYLCGLGYDLSERYVDRNALRASEERYKSLIETMNEGLIVRDRNGSITYVNGQLCRMLGFKRHELLEKNMSSFLSETNLVIMRTKLSQSRDGNLGAYEIDWKTKQGKRVPTLVSEQLLFDDKYQYNGSIAIITDITNRKLLEEQLRQSQKMEAVGLLAGGIAHDFNNLLTGIIGYSELTLMKIGPHDPLLDDVGRILNAGKRARDLTQQLLAFSRKQILRIQVTNLNEIVLKIEKILRRIIGEDIKLETRLEKDLWSVKADTAQIEQILMNLAVNARDAMRTGGQLIIETKNTAIDMTKAQRFHNIRAGSYVTLSVRDNGCGMSDETVQRIFEPFFTTKDFGKGTGLGLSTVYGIVRQHDGHIHVESKVDEGTSFEVYLPGSKDRPSDHLKVIESSVKESKGECILVVEDEELVRKLACRILGAHKYKVLQAANATDALALAFEHEAKIDLLLTDVVMPGLSGRELYEELSRQRPETKVIYMSGYTRNFIDPHGVLDPDIPFLQKPLTIDSLTRKVREILDSGS